MTLILCVVSLLLGFFCGAVFGVRDCKKQYGIPKGASGWDGYWCPNLCDDDVEGEVNGNILDY